VKKALVLMGLLFLTLTGCGNNNGVTVDEDYNVVVEDGISEETVPATQAAQREDIRALNLSYRRTEFLMGGLIEITIFDVICSEVEREELCDLMDEAFEMIFDMERRWTVNDEGGEVQKINEMAGISPVEVESDTFYLIERAIFYSVYSDSAFNAAIGPLTGLWNIAMPGTRRPDDGEIEEILPLLDPSNVILDAEAQTVFLTEVGMGLDLGGIAKGFMPDLVAELFLENGIDRALLIVGGEVIALGGRSDGTPFRIGVRNPFFDAEGESREDEYLVGSLPIYSQAMVTSGTYNRYLAHQETQTFYHHIFDSHTGFPFESDIVSISIIADTGLLGEVYTKIVFAMGVEVGLAYVENHPGLEVLMISQDGGIYISSGLQREFNFLLPDLFEIRTP